MDYVLNNRYARKADGTEFYPINFEKNEYPISFSKLIIKNNRYVYPINLSGLPIYRFHKGKEVYEIFYGKEIIGTDKEGNEFYAKDEFLNEYYPRDRIPAFLSDGTPKYAISRAKKTIFPNDDNKNEYYLCLVDLSKPTTIPNKYAKLHTGDEIYPCIMTPDGNESEYLINNVYAKDRCENFFYPKDRFKNEYYKTVVQMMNVTTDESVSNVILNRFALTNDGKIILPALVQPENLNSHLKNKINKNTFLGFLYRGDTSSDILLNVSDPKFEPSDFVTYYYKDWLTGKIKSVVPKPLSKTTNILSPAPLPKTTDTLNGNKKKNIFIWLLVIFIVILCLSGYFLLKHHKNSLTQN